MNGTNNVIRILPRLVGIGKKGDIEGVTEFSFYRITEPYMRKIVHRKLEERRATAISYRYELYPYRYFDKEGDRLAGQ
jgi:hypothetical protein